eukprot:GHVS01005725.1.p1 GENE.GHVS01005725.1~~GHVS01005725.1.p1  ORF type:complete len:452 (+),score=44.13 GHVS01005725.1:297-1652(+)
METLGREIEVDEDPLRVVLGTVRNGEGVDALDESGEGKRLMNEWQMRVANYFGYCIEHELLVGKFGLAEITDAIGLAKPQGDAQIREILSFLLHLRPRDMTLPYSGVSIISQVEDVAGFERSVIFNPHILKVYLDIGFVAKMFPKGNEGSYLKLLAVLLKSSASPVNLKTAVCRQILQAASAQLVSADVFAPLIPALIDVVSRRAAPGSSSYLSVFALASLVKLSLSSIPVKNMLINLGVSTMVANIVKSRDDDLTEHGLTLVVNLTEDTAHKQRFLATGILYTLIDILLIEYNSLHHQKQRLLLLIVTIIGQLATDDQSRDLLCERFPGIDCLLYMFHTSQSGSEYKHKVLICLTQLSRHNWQTRQRIGKHTITGTITDIRRTVDATKLTVLLQFLQAMSLYKPNCLDMRNSQIEAAFSHIRAHFSDPGVQLLVEELRRNIWKNTRFLYS